MSDAATRSVEAGWLIGLAFIPLFNLVGLVYDEPRTALFRAIALTMLALHLIAQMPGSTPTSLLAQSRRGARMFFRQVWPLSLIAASLVLSTVTSISALDSIWGSFFRGQGLYLGLTQIIWALLLIAHLHTPAQRQRLLLAITLGGTLTAVTAILEPALLGADWLTWRPGGTQGNPIFLGGYLVMVIPFTLAALLGHNAGDERQGLKDKAARLALIAALLVQVVALALSGSRGPWIGALAGAVVFGGLLLWQRQRWIVIAGTLISLIGIGTLVVGLNMAVNAVPALASVPMVNRLNLAQDAQTGTGRVRLVLWQAVGQIVTQWPPVVPDGDAWHFLRPVLGYGLDTAAIVYLRVYPPELAHIEDPGSMWDRAHNETLDVLTMQGALGLLTYLIVGSVCVWRGRQHWRAAKSMSQRVWIAAPLAALAAHVVEAQFAFTLTTTGMLVWLCVAVLLGWPLACEHRQPIADPTPARLTVARRLKQVAAGTGAIALMIVALRVDVGSIWANALAGEAHALNQHRDWQHSIDRYDQALALAPWQATYYVFRGEVFYNLARALSHDQSALQVQLLEAAERALATARRLIPLDLEVNFNSGVLHAFWADIDPAHLSVAERYYQRTFALAPTNALLRGDLGHVYHNHGRYADALTQYAAALQIDPQFSTAYLDQGLAYVALGQRDAAQQAFQTALQLMPNCTECRIQLQALRH